MHLHNKTLKEQKGLGEYVIRFQIATHFTCKQTVMALKRLKESRSEAEKASRDVDPRQNIRRITTPYDDAIPATDESATTFYMDVIRVYLGLCSGATSLDDVSLAIRELRAHPEYTKNPIDPTFLPINEEYKQRLLENIKTLGKYNLVTTDAVKSALSFAFLIQDVPINPTDLSVLRYFSKHPLETLVMSGENLGLSSKTVARSLKRLGERFSLRFGYHLDTSAFDVQSVILFFTVVQDADWLQFENALATFPFTKGLVKTSMTDMGYATFLIPGGKRSIAAFRAGIAALRDTVFDYMQLHTQEGMGSHFNLSLYENGVWGFPSDVKAAFETGRFPQDKSSIRHLECGGSRKGFKFEDFLVASEYKANARAPPSSVAQGLRMRGWDIDTKRVSQSMRKIRAKDMGMPFIIYGGLGLSANFCFEILCNDEWKKRILSVLPAFPNVMHYISNKGILVWIQVPSHQQVDYYQAFRSLEKETGVKSVQSIMTIVQKGTRAMHELMYYWDHRRNQWSVPLRDLDLGAYLLNDDMASLY